MARAENVQTLTGIAGEALAIYRFIHLMADGKFDYVDTDDLRADGITAEAASADLKVFAFAPISQPAIMLVEAGEAIAVGDLVAADGGTGKAIGAAAAGAGQFTHGVAMTASTADGDIIEVLLANNARQV